MKLNKYVKLKEPQKEQLSEEEQALYDDLLKRVELNAASGVAVKRKVDLWKILTPLVSVLGAIAITLTCVFTLRSKDDFLYQDEFIKNQESTFEEMRADFKYINLDYIKENIDQLSMSYDTVSNDKLFYGMHAYFELSTIDLVVVINENYNYKFEIKGEPTSKELDDYTVSYVSESLRGEPQINYRGFIKVETETVYFDYVQIPAMGDEAFFESIQQIIQIKSPL